MSDYRNDGNYSSRRANSYRNDDYRSERDSSRSQRRSSGSTSGYSSTRSHYGYSSDEETSRYRRAQYGDSANREYHSLSRNATTQRRASQASRGQRGGERIAGAGSVIDNNLRSNSSGGRNRPNIIAIVVAVIVLVAIGFGIRNFIDPASYTITINGAEHEVKRGCTIDTLLNNSYVVTKSGDLLAVDGSMLQEGGGERFQASVNGGETTSDGTTPLKKNDTIDIWDGGDSTETYTETTEEIPFEQVGEMIGSGAIHSYIEGQNGVQSTKTGDISGITITEETQPVVNAQFVAYNAIVGDEKMVALTFDDGPWPETTQEILDILKENGARATFFTIGNQIAERPDDVKRAYDEGHQICTHSWDHAAGSGGGVNMNQMSAQEQIDEVEKGRQAITDVTGQEASTVFRSPGGNFSTHTAWNMQPYISAEINWNIDTVDWSRPGSDAIKRQILSARPGSIILMHDGGGDRSQTVQALREALPQLKEQGFTFVTIDELMEANQEKPGA